MNQRRYNYDVLADAYDQGPHEEVALAFARAVRRTLAPYARSGSVLDLGCGTGLSAEHLARFGWSVIGVDGSTRALAAARRRCRRLGRRVRFVHAELTALPRFEGCTAAIACGDVVNHFTSRRALGAMFRAVARVLAPPAVFVFDALNRYCFERYWDGEPYYFEGRHGDLVMECDWNPRRSLGICRMVAYHRRGRRFAKAETLLRERLWESRDLRLRLRAAGFDPVRHRPWSPWVDQHLEPSHDRTLWTAHLA